MTTPLPFKNIFFVAMLFFSTILMGADPLSYADDASRTPLLDYFPVIVFSETGAFANMFQFVAGVAQEFALGGDLFWIGAVGMGVAIVSGVYRAFLRYSISGSVKEVLFPVAAAVLLVMPSQSVTIFDGRTAMSTDVRIVDNVPWFIATTASMTSVATAKLMYIVDDTSAAIGTTTDFRYGAQGLGAPEEFALKAIQKARLDSNVSTALNRAVKECLIPNSIDATFFNYIGEHTDANDKFNAYDAMRQIGNNSAVATTQMEGNESCQSYISTNFSQAVEDAENARIEKEVLGHLNFLEKEKLAALTAAFLGLTDNKNYSDSSSETLSSFIGYLKNYSFNGALAGSIQNARAEALGGGDNIAIVTETTAKATMGNLQVSGLGNWRAMGELVPLAHSYLLALIYAASILMGIVVLWYGYEKGLSVMKEFFIGLVTFEFVKVAFVLANNNVLFHAQENAIGLLAGDGSSGVSMNNPASIPYIAQHLEYVANMSGMAGALGLAAMLFIPGVVFGGKVAAAMGILGNTGGMVQNKTPQSTVEDIAKEKGRQKDLEKLALDTRMREELERAGIHVGANSDVGAVYSEYTAGMDKAAQNLATTSMYKDYDNRYTGVQANSLRSGGALIGAGKQSSNYTNAEIQGLGEGEGAKSLGMSMETYRADKDFGVLNSDNTLSAEAAKGQYASSVKAAGALIGSGMTGAKAEDIFDSSKANTIDSMRGEIEKGQTLIKKFGKDLNGTTSIRDEADEKELQSEMDGYVKDKKIHSDKATALESQARSINTKTEKGKKLAEALKQDASYEREQAKVAGERAKEVGERLAHLKANPTFVPMSHSDVVAAEQSKAVDSRVGSAAGAKINMEKTPDIYSRTAMMSEMSSAQSAMQKISAFGSVSGAVAADALGARKSAEEFKTNMKAYSDSFGGGNDLLKAMQQGGDEASKKISDAMRGFANTAYQTAHQGYQGQIGTAKGYVEERSKYGDNYQAKLAETSTKTQAEQGMQSIRGMKDYMGLSEGAAINALANQAGRTSYVQAQSTAQDMKMKDDAFGKKGFEEAGLTMARKQTDEAIGATRGIKYELKKRGDKGFQDVAQSGVESQVESGLGAIRGAKGIHSLAWQSGVKSESDSNALRASIQQAGGERAYIGLNEFVARKGITGMQSDRDAFNDTFGADGYLGHKGFSAFRLAGAATGAKGYAEMTGSANAIGNTGLDVFKQNAQTETENSALSTMRKIEGAGGAQNYIIASSTAAAAQGASIASDLAGAGSQSNMIQNAAYSSFQKAQQSTKDRTQDTINKLAEIDKETGLARTTDLGEKGLENTAVANSIMKTKQASMREKVASMFEASNFPDRLAREATMAEYGITENDLKDGGKNMSASALGKFILNSEKRMEKMEMSILDGHGNIATATTRNMATKNEDGTISWKSDMENLSSFQSIQTGEKRDDHLADTVGALTKNTIAENFGASVLTGLEAIAVGGGSAFVASKAYDKYVKDFSGTGTKATTMSGKEAIKAEDGHFYDADGNKVDNDLKPTAKKAWDRLRTQGDRLSPFKKGSEESDHKGDGDKQQSSDTGKDNIAEHNTPPNKDLTGSNPSHTNNSTTKAPSKQEAFDSAKEHLAKVSNTPNAEFAKGELAMLVGQKEHDLKQKHDSGQISDSDFKKQMSGINNLKSKLSSDVDIGTVDTQKAGITAKELNEAGISMKTVESGGGKKYQAIDMDKSGEVSKQVAVSQAKKSIDSAEKALANEIESSRQNPTNQGSSSEAQSQPQKRSDVLKQQKQALIEKQNADPRNPAMTKSDYKDAISDLDKAIDGAVKDEARADYKANRSQQRREGRDGRQSSIFGDMVENIKNSSVGKMASNAIDSASDRISAATEAAEHTHGGGKYAAVGKMSAFAGTLLAGTALSSLFSSEAQAAEVPVKVSPKPIMSNEPIKPPKDMLETTAENLGTATLATGAVATLSGLDNKAGTVGKVASKAFAPVAMAAGVAETASDVNKRLEKGDKEGAALEVVQGGLSAGGGWAGAATGAAIGTAVMPGIGTAVGGVVGGIAGYLGGEKVGQIALDAHDEKKSAFENISNTPKGTSAQTAQSATASPTNEHAKSTEQNPVNSSTQNQNTAMDASAFQPMVEQLNNFASNLNRGQPNNESAKISNWRESAPIASSFSQGGQHIASKLPTMEINESAIAQNQLQDYANRANYMESIKQGGGYQNIQRVAIDNPIHPAMSSNYEQRSSQEALMALAASNNHSPSIPMTALDIQQTHQTRQLAQTQADYIKEVSRSMDEMVGTLSELGGYFESFFAKAEGRVSDKA